MQRKNWTIVIILALCINLVKRFLKNKPNVPVKNIAAVPDYAIVTMAMSGVLT